MLAPAYGLQPKAILKSSLQFKKLAIGLFEEVTTWDLVVWMSVLDVVGKKASSPSSEGAFWACQRFGMPEHMVIQVVPLVKKKNHRLSPDRPRTVHWVARHTCAIRDASHFAGVRT